MAGGLVVLAEDDDVLREILRRALEGAGFRVEAFADGAQALAACRTSKPALIVTDNVLPGLKGTELLLERLRAEGVKTPALIISSDIVEAARSLPGTAALKKPFQPADFTRVVRTLLPE